MKEKRPLNVFCLKEMRLLKKEKPNEQIEITGVTNVLTETSTTQSAGKNCNDLICL